MGSDSIALPLLESLHTRPPAGHTLRAVFTQPDRPVGRGKRIQPNAIARWADERGVAVFKPERLDVSTETWFRDEAIDFVIVMAYGHLLKKSLLALSPLGFVNLHASLLPAYRGASPIEAAVADGLNETGVSLMRIIPRMDAGEVADRETISISAEDTTPIVREKLAAASLRLIERNGLALSTGRLVWQPQDETQVTYTRKLTKADSALDFHQSATVLVNRIRALTPWPGSSFIHEGVSIKVAGARAGDAVTAAPGTVLGMVGEALGVAAGGSTLLISQLQRPGGQWLDAAAFLRGYPLETGTTLDSMPMLPLAAPVPFNKPTAHSK